MIKIKIKFFNTVNPHSVTQMGVLSGNATDYPNLPGLLRVVPDILLKSRT
jgi:hypothetical protein